MTMEKKYIIRETHLRETLERDKTKEMNIPFLHN